MDQKNLYRDIAGRCEGDIYIGVVGPVRTGKSTFIKRFMELLVLPNIENADRRARVQDELPVSGAGRTITTTEPKFVPNEAAEVRLRDQASFRVRLVDCVGYLADGALGLNEGEAARMVRTPWFDYDIPFEQAAELGTRKVIKDHAAVGVVMTTDGTVTELPREAYEAAEERVVRELKELGKPFIVVLNTLNPEGAQARSLKNALSEKYDVAVEAVNVEQMRLSEVGGLMESLLFEFPLTELRMDVPAWLGALDEDHYLVTGVMEQVRRAAAQMSRVRDYEKLVAAAKYSITS